MNIAIIGAGITGVSAARMAKDLGLNVIVFEKTARPGGLVKCERKDGHLFHRVGGHVFNSKNQQVTEWFWKQFDQEKDFIKAKRNAGILLSGALTGYPIENYLYRLDKKLVRQIISEIMALNALGYKSPYSYPHFEAFLKGNFGETLYGLYFKPYNQKIWQTDLKEVALEWLEGKLPMPDYAEILLSNIIQEDESSMVHSTFYYPKQGGSQFIIDTIAKGLDIRCNYSVEKIEHKDGKWTINRDHTFDKIVYTGDVRLLDSMLLNGNEDTKSKLRSVTDLKSNGTSNMLCETDDTDLSWLYLPDPGIKAHRIIYTGNFSDTNNAPGKRKSCVVEFSGQVSYAEMVKELHKLPGNLNPVDRNYEANSYVIQDHYTREKIRLVKDSLEPIGFYLCGRFAEWEYYNMDKAIEAGLTLLLGLEKDNLEKIFLK